MDTFFSTKTKTSEAFAKEKQELRLHQSFMIYIYNSQRGLRNDLRVASDT